MSDLRELFCRNLRELRESRGYSQRELSLKCGFAHSYVGQLERGQKDPSFKSLLELAEELGVSVVDFFRDDDESDDLQEAVLALEESQKEVLQSLSVLASQVESEVRMAGVYDSEGRILGFNRTVFEILHETENELLGKPAWELEVFGDRDENRDWMQDRIQRMKDVPKVYRRHFPLFTNKGDVLDAEVSLTPFTVGDVDQEFILSEAHRLEDIETEIA